MALDQGGKGGLVPLVDEAVEQLGVGQPAGRARAEQCFDLPEELHRWSEKKGRWTAILDELDR